MGARVIYCRGCQRSWLDPAPGNRDECTCTCSDPADPLYEAWAVDPDPADLTKVPGVPDLPGRSLVAVEFLQPDRDGQIRVLLTCDCSFVTGLTAEIPDTGSAEAAFTCEGCGTSRWFTITATGDGNGS
jgi:hypothetical protein